ncbi:RND transporter [Acidocella aquatica]|uniref:RND transporter n=1 Tax=Acidocella aquatica TaxID=1922313 RepID=A0ABQ6A372_9PROT|nr:MMPL family transporter [Acidocella aquatica]GLR66083.1 RND transporter [Acidocella aquatica]
MNYLQSSDDMRIADIADFDRQSGSVVERILFNHRPIVLLLCLFATIFFGYAALHVRISASYNEMLPTHQPFIVNYFKHYDDLQGQGNAIRIDVEKNGNGSIVDANYLATLEQLSDQVYLLPGVDRPFMTSLWTPSVRWMMVTPVGFNAGPVIGAAYNGSPSQLAVVQQNIAKAGIIGSIVANDFHSSMIYVPLMQHNNLTGKALDYGDLARQLNALRNKYKNKGVTLHVIGFAMVVGDLINGINRVLTFFGISVIIAIAILYWYTRCVRSTLLVVTASITAVIWQLGILTLAGKDLNPYSVLVPFLVFSIGMSHGAQKMNGVVQDVGRGSHPLIAARYTFRRLFLAGFAALTCDAVSFAVLFTIRIQAIQDLAVLASIGVVILIFTNLIMLPILLSYTGVSKNAAQRSLRQEADATGNKYPLWHFLDLFTRRRYAAAVVVCAAILASFGWYIGHRIQVGDLSPGAPEFRQSSQYNRDNAYIVGHYATGSDNFVVLVDSAPGHCQDVATLQAMDNLEWRLQQLPQVLSTSSLASMSAKLNMLMTEGSPKWLDFIPNQQVIDDHANNGTESLKNSTCSFAPINVSLTDHKAATLQSVVKMVKDFSSNPQNQGPYFKIQLAGGNAGIEAATNIAIEQSNLQILMLVYASVILFCFITFRSWRLVICTVIPLAITSLLCQALMVWLNIGIKVATLPVIALGVGIGVDYALYVLSVVIKQLKNGATLSEAYYRALLFTGKVVLLTGFTLAVGVATWIFSPIKFQADMGLLLCFMFLWNMVGALVLLPALAYFLLPQQRRKALVT